MSPSDVSRSSSRRADGPAHHRHSSRSPGRGGGREREHCESSRREERNSCHWSGSSDRKEKEAQRYNSREAEEGRSSRDHSRRPVGRMRGWGEGEVSSSTSSASGRSGTKSSSRLPGRERDAKEERRRRSASRSRSGERPSQEGTASRKSAGHGSSSNSRQRGETRDSSGQRDETRDSSRHREAERSRPSSRSDRPREESSRTRRSPPHSNGRSNSSSSQARRSSNDEASSRAAPSADRKKDDGASRKSQPRESRPFKRRFQDGPPAVGAPAEAEAPNGVGEAKRSLLPVPESSSSGGNDESRDAAEPGKESTVEEKGTKDASSSITSSSGDKVSRLERFRALKRQKQQPERPSSDDRAPPAGKEASGTTGSANAFSDWLPSTPNVKFAVSSRAADADSGSKAAAANSTPAGPTGAAGAASAAAAAAAVAAAQAVASAALAAAGLAAASAAAVPAAERRQEQSPEITESTEENKEATTKSPATADSARASESPPPAAAEGEKGGMKPPKSMSRNRLKKHQQAMLLKQLQHKTAEAAPEAKGDTDLLDAFMSALEVEAKEELTAAKAEDEGHVEALGCISSRGSEPLRPQSISLEEISRWEEVEATYLPAAAIAKAAPAAAPAAATTEASPAAPAAPAPVVAAKAAVAAADSVTAAQPAAASIKVDGEQPGTGPAAAASAVDASSSMAAGSPRVKHEQAADATPSAAGATPAAATAPALAATNGVLPDTVKTDGEKLGEPAAAAAAAAAEEVDPEEAKYHELFLKTLRKGPLKGPLRSGGGTAAADDGQGQEPKDAEPEEEEVLLYSDHEEEEEEAAKGAPGGPEGEAKGQNSKEDENEFQAKEQLANLSYFDLVKRVGLKKELPLVDHASCKFPPIKKNLYVQVKELTDLKDHEVEAIRKTNGNIKVRGKQCPRPVSSFHQCGLPEKILRHLELRGFDKPFPVQSQCIPILMCGRDLIAVAETGSGKTLAYSLPLVRHVLSIKRQYKEYLAKQKEEKLARLEQQQEQQGGPEAADKGTNSTADTTAETKPNQRGKQNKHNGDDEERDRYRKNEKGERMLIYGNFKEGMIGLVIAPTRELSLQISKEVSRLCKLVDLNVASLYGGAGIGGQLGQIKRGVDVVVGTPGRLIDVLTLNAGKFTSLKMRLPVAGFAASALARRILYKPIEVVVGEKGRTAAKVQQYVEVLDEERKFYRLLQLLGDWQDYGSIIIFVNKQIEADELFAELMKYGYQALVLHGGQDQTDREFTIQEFKDGTRTLLIATSVAARGLDVPSVVLVINFCCPSHIEDYVHRIGRTGRAGNIGVSYTFITAQEADKAEELEGALIQSGQTVPPALSALSAEFRVQCNMGLAQKKKRGGFGGKGFTFSVTERSRQQQQMQQAKKELSGVNDFDEVEEVELLLQRDDFSPPTSGTSPPHQLALTNAMSTMDAAMAAATAAAAARGGGAGTSPGSLQSAVEAAAAKAALLAKHQLAGTDAITQPVSSTEAVARVKLVAKILKLQDAELAKRPPMTPPPPPPGLPPPGSEKTKLTSDQQVDFMLQQALKGLQEEERGQYREKLREAYKKHLSPPPKVQQKAAPGMQLALASSVTGQPIPKDKDPFMDAAAEALSILKQGTSASSSQLQAALDKIKAFSDSGELAAAISSVSAPSNPTLGKVPGLSEKGFVCPETGNFVDELEINDYPQVARYKLTQKELMSRIMEETGAVLYVKGQHVEPALKHRTQLAPGVKFLHVEIIAPTPIQVQRARHAVYELVESIALKSLNLTSTQRQSMGRYSVV